METFSLLSWVSYFHSNFILVLTNARERPHGCSGLLILTTSSFVQLYNKVLYALLCDFKQALHWTGACFIL